MIDKRFEDITDEELILEFQKNDSYQSFEALVLRYKNPLMNFIFRFLGDYDLCEDVLQETMIRIFKNKNSFNPRFKFSTWIYTIAVNLVKSELKKRKRRNYFSFIQTDNEKNEIFQIADNGSRPDELVDGKIKEEIIQQALLKIKDKHREAVVLRDIQELSYEEIAEITKTSIGTVKTRINRGRAELRKLLKDIYKE